MLTSITTNNKVKGHVIRYRVPGRPKLMKDFHIVKQHCLQKNIPFEDVVLVTVALTDMGEIEIDAEKE